MDQTINAADTVAAKRPKNADTIVITKEALAKIQSWIAQIEIQAPSIRLTRSQLVSWLLCHYSEQLSTDEIKKIENDFFDEVRFAQWAIKELKAAKGRGEAVTLSEIMSRNRDVNPVVSGRRGRPKKQPIKEKENDVFFGKNEAFSENNLNEKSLNSLVNHEVK